MKPPWIWTVTQLHPTDACADWNGPRLNHECFFMFIKPSTENVCIMAEHIMPSERGQCYHGIPWPWRCIAGRCSRWNVSNLYVLDCHTHGFTTEHLQEHYTPWASMSYSLSSSWCQNFPLYMMTPGSPFWKRKLGISPPLLRVPVPMLACPLLVIKLVCHQYWDWSGRQWYRR